MQRRTRIRRVVHQVQPFVGHVRAEPAVRDGHPPGADLPGQATWSGRIDSRLGIGQPAIRLACQPVRRLPRGAGDDQRDGAGRRTRQQFGVVQRTERRGDAPAAVQQLAQVVQALGEPLAALRMLQPVGGELHRPVAGGEAQHQASAGQPVDARRGLGQVDRLAQGKHRAAGGQGDTAGPRGQIAKVGERVEHLSGIAEAWVEQRYVAYPDGGESQSIDFFDQPRLAQQHPHVALVETQRQEQAQGQRVCGEHAPIARVPDEGRRRGALQQGAHGPTAGSGRRIPRCTAGRRAMRRCQSSRWR